MKVVAFERSVQGTGASRRLRNSGKTPGIIYGSKNPAVAIELDHNALFHALRKEAFHSSILDLEIDGKAQKVLLRDYQMHPFKPLVLHIDFQRVSATEKVHMRVPLHFINAENSNAVKLQGAVVSHITTEIEVSCLPADLPEFIEVDLGGIEVGGHGIHAKDLTLPKGVSLVLHVEQENPVLANARIPAVKAADTEVAPAAAAAAPAADAAKDKA
ncbi:MAG: 50S ribosomal protein L25/general stress protein Ctc [Betaproteobacteria bacterium]|jgi:large subunit ribosomal protein L25|uniref:50S ribosomal protein L25/general stress protein Ctc n=1 Tax=Polynucleobacter finlandensis TaxID=1855894 RepID=UPI001C0CF729|nr:50S ribosomal protein L25/general stress protein Ctc [Polynucleobacter finlandensis]MBU3543563.1 50S ribosomal protein L25/general stress protein Ctc [Polynucleobacter finlandensis]